MSATVAPAVAITGLGLVTPLGINLRETWQTILSGRFITDHGRVPIEPRGTPPRITQLALLAAREALADAGGGRDWFRDHSSASQSSAEGTALIVGTSKGTVETWATAPPHMRNSAYVVGAWPGLADLARDLARELQLCAGPRMTCSAACASGLHALARGVMLLGTGECRRALVVAAESSLHPLFVGSFHRLGVLADPAVGCRPFDENRCGFLMSEAAAAVCLEPAADRAQVCGRKPPVLIERFALGSDPTHITGMDPHGRPLRRLLANVLGKCGVDLVHAHGTATIANDPIELSAIAGSLPDDCMPAIYSHKAALGHSLGASGLVSVVLSVRMHEAGLVPGNVCTSRPIAAGRLRPARDTQPRHLDRSMVIAAGFGGALAALTLVSGDSARRRMPPAC